MDDQYLVVSDLHLCDVEEHQDGWKAYKSARHVIDREFAALIDSVLDQRRQAADAAAGTLTLVLNGDIVDFDLVTAAPEEAEFRVSAFERRRGLLPTPEKSAWKLARVLQDHALFVETLARVLAEGHRLVYVMGNHDRELHFPEVQRVLTSAIDAAMRARGHRLAPEAIRFEPWFFHVPGKIYAEHGQQYDHYSSFRYVLSPVVQTNAGPMIAIPMGDLANRYLINLMGFFNPHASDFILNVFHYAAHWFKYYAFSKRGLLWNWLWGSMLVMFRLLQLKKRIHSRPVNYDACIAHAARRARLPVETLCALGDLQPPPITTRFYRIAREFWLDRVIIALVMTAGTVTLALAPVPLWVKLMVPFSSFPLLYSIYERLAQGDTIFTVDNEIPAFARRVADIVGVRVVTFGHTHRPRLVPLDSGISFVDTGTWAPITGKLDHRRLAPGYRNYLLATFSGDRVTVKLDVWQAPHSADSTQNPSQLRLAS